MAAAGLEWPPALVESRDGMVLRERCRRALRDLTGIRDFNCLRLPATSPPALQKEINCILYSNTTRCYDGISARLIHHRFQAPQSTDILM